MIFIVKFLELLLSVHSVQSLSHVQLFATPRTAALPAVLTSSQSLLKLISSELLMLSNHHILVVLFSRLQSFPASGSFLMSQFFPSGSQSIGAPASASALPMNIQHLFPSELTGLISLQSKGLSRVFSSTTI